MRFLGIFLLSLILSGCFGFPLPVHHTIEPKTTVSVEDQAGKRIPGAEVTLIIARYGYVDHEMYRFKQITDPKGKTRFNGKEEFTIELAMLHAPGPYYWVWCIQKNDYETLVSQDQRKAVDRLNFQLKPGERTKCPSPPKRY